MADPKATAVGRNLQDLTGRQCDYLYVIGKASYRGHRGRDIYWNCRCVCGKEYAVRADVVTKPGKSCGCITRQKIIAACRSHGMEGSPEYRSWSQAKCRCCNPRNHAYASYGGRGIKMCERWRNSFEDFLADMGPRPSLDYSLDRYPNNDGDYEPGNCRWATRSQQQTNRRNTRFITRDGVTLPLAEWARRVGLSASVIHARISHGWTAERALATPKINRPRVQHSPHPG